LRDVGHQSAWIIGAVCPARDTGVALVMTRLDTATMNLFLAELGQAVAPGAHGIVLMDKAGWHTSGDLVVPENLSLVFLPPYSPELNPIERGYISETIASRTAFSRPLTKSSTPAVTPGIGCSAKPGEFDPCAPIPGSNGSATSQVGYNTQEQVRPGRSKTPDYLLLSNNLFRLAKARYAGRSSPTLSTTSSGSSSGFTAAGLRAFAIS
jgi:hypothetical protein